MPRRLFGTVLALVDNAGRIQVLVSLGGSVILSAGLNAALGLPAPWNYLLFVGLTLILAALALAAWEHWGRRPVLRISSGAGPEFQQQFTPAANEGPYESRADAGYMTLLKVSEANGVAATGVRVRVLEADPEVPPLDPQHLPQVLPWRGGDEGTATIHGGEHAYVRLSSLLVWDSVQGRNPPADAVESRAWIVPCLYWLTLPSLKILVEARSESGAVDSRWFRLDKGHDDPYFHVTEVG